MNNYIDLSKLSTPVLKELRKIFIGVPAQASKMATADGGKRLKQLTAEVENLKKLNERRKMLEDAGVDDVFDFEKDKSFILNHTDERWQWFLNHLIEQKEKAEMGAVAEKHTFKVPPSLFAVNDKSNVEVVRDGLKARAGRNGGSEN